MNRFAFIVHPIEIKDFARRYPITRYLPSRLVERLMRLKKPAPVGEIRGIRSAHDGSEVSGVFIGCPLTTRVMATEPAERTLPTIIASAQVGAAEGAGIVGLGAMTSVVGDAGITVSQHVPIAVTTGNTYTVATALQGARKAAELMGVSMPEATVAVLGATGSIGRVCAEILGDEVARVVLVVRDEAKGQALANQLQPAAKATIEVSRDLDAVLPTADILVCVSAAVDALVQPRHLKRGAVICDVARPRDVSVAVAKERDDVLVIEGGVVKPPGSNIDLGLNFGFPPGLMYACMAETSVLALAGRFENFSLGRDLQRAKVDEIASLAALHGYELAGFRSFERALTEQDIASIRQHAANGQLR